MTRGEEGVEDKTNEAIKLTSSEICSISTDPSPIPQTVEFSLVILVGKFLLIGKFGIRTLHNAFRKNHLGDSNKSGATCLRYGYQKY